MIDPAPPTVEIFLETFQRHVSSLKKEKYHYKMVYEDVPVIPSITLRLTRVEFNVHILKNDNAPSKTSMPLDCGVE